MNKTGTNKKDWLKNLAQNPILYIEKHPLDDFDYNNQYAEMIGSERYTIHFADGEKVKVILDDREFAIDWDRWSDRHEEIYQLINKHQQVQNPVNEILGLSANCFKSAQQRDWMQVKRIEKDGNKVIIDLEKAYDKYTHETNLSTVNDELEFQFAKEALKVGLFDSEAQMQAEWSKFLLKNMGVTLTQNPKGRK